MRVLLLSDVNSAHTKRWAVSLSKKGIDLAIFSISTSEDTWTEELMIPLFSPGKFDPGIFSRPLLTKTSFLKLMPAVNRAIRAFSPDIVHAHYATSYGFLGAATGFHPFVISAWGSDVLQFPKRNPLGQLLLRYNFSRADLICSTSVRMMEEIKRFSNKNVELVPFGIDLRQFYPEKGNTLFEDGTFVIGTIKALEPEYGIDRLINVFDGVRKRLPERKIKLLIVGGGKLEDELKRLTEELGISADVVFHGSIAHSEVPRFMNMLDIFVTLSRTESFGVSVLEASACEKPVVVSDVGGLPEVVESGVTGLIVPENDPDAAIAALEKLMTEPELAKTMGANGRKRVATIYDWETSVDRMTKLYEQLTQLKILFLTQYYPPEVGAPQNRLSELAVRFARAGNQVEVLTAMPNYPFMQVFDGYRGKWYIREEMEGVTVHRSSIFVKQSQSIPVRLLVYFSFVFSSMWIGLSKLNRFDLIICESPPLFLGISAWILKKAKRAKLIFNVSDLWPESAEKLGLVTNRVFLRISTLLEEFLYRHSDLISGQTQGIVTNISARNPQKPVFWLKNGVDLSFYGPGKGTPGWRTGMGFAADDFIAFYGGILGHAQGLEVILLAAKEFTHEPNMKFVLAGEGPLKHDLMDQAARMELDNVVFLPAYPKSRMPDVIAETDVSIIPLRKVDLFKGAIPSKIFESLAMGKPILLGVEGEAHTLFIEEGKCGLSFIPEEAESLVKAIRSISGNPSLYGELSKNAYFYVSRNFNRDKIFADFQRFIQVNLDAKTKG